MESLLLHWDMPCAHEPPRLVGRVTPCAPFEGLDIGGGAHGVTRPTLRFMGSTPVLVGTRVPLDNLMEFPESNRAWPSRHVNTNVSDADASS